MGPKSMLGTGDTSKGETSIEVSREHCDALTASSIGITRTCCSCETGLLRIEAGDVNGPQKASRGKHDPILSFSARKIKFFQDPTQQL